MSWDVEKLLTFLKQLSMAKRIRDALEISQWTLKASRSANAKESDFGAKKVGAKINCIAEYFEKSNEDDLNPDVIEG